MTKDKFFTIKEFAALVPCSDRTLLRWRKCKGKMTTPKLSPARIDDNGRVYYSESQLEDALALLIKKPPQSSLFDDPPYDTGINDNEGNRKVTELQTDCAPPCDTGINDSATENTADVTENHTAPAQGDSGITPNDTLETNESVLVDVAGDSVDVFDEDTNPIDDSRADHTDGEDTPQNSMGTDGTPTEPVGDMWRLNNPSPNMPRLNYPDDNHIEQNADATENDTPTADDDSGTIEVDTGNGVAFDDSKGGRIAQALQFLNLLFAHVPANPIRYAYLWTKNAQAKRTYPFAITNPDERKKMAVKAIELSDAGNETYYSVNLTDTPPFANTRAQNDDITLQLATVTDVDTLGGKHKNSGNKQFPPTFDDAKNLLPFEPSLLVNSGYGLHGLCIYDKPIVITDANREQAIARNIKFIKSIRARAGKYSSAVDSVQDLPRILRLPGTRNYKLGISEDAPICHLVEDTQRRFSVEDMDERLAVVDNPPPQESLPPTPHAKEPSRNSDDDSGLSTDPAYNLYRAQIMLDAINPADLDYSHWLAVISSCKNVGISYADVDAFNQRDNSRYNVVENQRAWESLKDPSFDIQTLHAQAQQFGYSEADARRQWYKLHPESDKHSTTNPESELQRVQDDLKAFDAERDDALEALRNVESFDADTVLTAELENAAAFAYSFNKQLFAAFKADVKSFGIKHPESKVNLRDWGQVVKEKSTELTNRRLDLITRRNSLQARLKAQSFATAEEILKGLRFPENYRVDNRGVFKINVDKFIPVCSRPVAIVGKSKADDDVIRYRLAFQDEGTWRTLSAEAATILNHRKLVDLSNRGLPVTSLNAAALVEYLSEFEAQNAGNLPRSKVVSRCGWHSFKGTELFVDPRRSNVIDEDGKKITVEVDSASQFAKALTTAGTLEMWKAAYLIAKQSPVARFIVAAAVAAPLLKPLGERNFMVYLCSPTTSGKSTALYLGASAIGNPDGTVRSFDGTKNGLLAAAADVCDFPFCLDERQSADGYLSDQLSLLTYSLSNGLGRSRAKRNGDSAPIKTWRTIAIANGEASFVPDNATGGAHTRVLTFNVPSKILSADDCRQIRSIIKDNYGHVLPLVVDKINTIGKDTLRTTFNNFVDTFKQFPFSNSLQAEHLRYLCLLTLADGLLNHALGIKTYDKDRQLIKPSDDAADAAAQLVTYIPRVEDFSDVARAKDFVLSFVAENQNSFAGGRTEIKRIKNLMGAFDDDWVYITAKALREHSTKEGFDTNKLISDLVTVGFFIPPDNAPKPITKISQASKQHKIGSFNCRCYRFRQPTDEDVGEKVT